MNESIKSEKRFPIQASSTHNRQLVTIPWEHAEEAYKEYAACYGTGQSLDRIAQRQGFGASEIVMLLVNRIKRIENEHDLSRGPG